MMLQACSLLSLVLLLIPKPPLLAEPIQDRVQDAPASRPAKSTKRAESRTAATKPDPWVLAETHRLDDLKGQIVGTILRKGGGRICLIQGQDHQGGITTFQAELVTLDPANKIEKRHPLGEIGGSKLQALARSRRGNPVLLTSKEVIAVDPAGKVLWRTALAQPGERLSMRFLRVLPSGDLVVGGARPTLKPGNAIDVTVAWLALLTDHGKLVWEHRFEDRPGSSWNDAIEWKKHIYCVGRQKQKYRGEILIASFGEDARLRWSHRIENHERQYVAGRALRFLPSGQLLVAAQGHDYGGRGWVSGGHTWIYCLDDARNLLWHRDFPGSSSPADPIFLLPAPSEAGHTWFGTRRTGGGSGPLKGEFALLRLDGQGRTIQLWKSQDGRNPSITSIFLGQDRIQLVGSLEALPRQSAHRIPRPVILGLRHKP